MPGDGTKRYFTMIQTGVFSQLARLMEMVDAMLTELGMGDLTVNERTVLMAMSASATRDLNGLPVSHTERARAHRLSRQISQPTFHRNLRRLMDRGIVSKSEGLGAGEYVIVSPRAPNIEIAANLDRAGLEQRIIE